MKVRKNISLEENIFDKGKLKSEKLFGGNFSIYIAYLINKDCGDIKEREVQEAKEIREEKQMLDKDVKSSVNDILNI